MNFFERYLTAWVAICIVVGIALGQWQPELFQAIGSLEYACGVAGSKVLLVLGHTSCGAVRASVDLKVAGKKASEATGCDHLDVLVAIIQGSIDSTQLKDFSSWSDFQGQNSIVYWSCPS